jgi:TonB-linked SusC/RagA family outer membrane protein
MHKHIFSRKRIFFFLFLVFGAAASQAHAQVSTDSVTAPALPVVKGQLMDDKTGEALSYANIVVKNSNPPVGANSDDKGFFEISTALPVTLVVSSVGYETKEITVDSNHFISVKIKSKSNELSGVVVVGYGTQRRQDITTAVSSISGEELAKQPVLNPLQAAQGEAAGVQIINSGTPGAQPTVIIRGLGTALGGTNVLYVVDGSLTQDISNINSADILTFDVLKDASATAIYGSRGANGVIIITTKKGTKGKMQVSYDATVGIQNATHLVQMANAAEYTNYYEAASGSTLPPSTANTDWYSKILRTAQQQSHNVSISGGSDDVTYILSLGYFDDGGIVINNDYKRYTLRSNIDYKINKYVKVGLDASFTYANNEAVNLGTAYNDAYRAAPIIPAEINGLYGNTSAYQNVGNPVLDLNQANNRIQNYRFQNTGYIEVYPVKGLTLRSSISADQYFTDNRTYNYEFNNNDSTFLTSGGNQKNPQSSLSLENDNYLYWVWNNTATYKTNFGKHFFTILAGNSVEQYKFLTQTSSIKDVPSDPTLWYINQGDPSTSQTSGSADQYRRLSFFGRLNYNYDGKYLFAATIRDDGSTRLPAQNRYVVYPSASAGWIVTKENFMHGQHFLDFLKLRAGYGKVGNDNIPTSAYQSSLQGGFAYPFNGTSGTNGYKVPSLVDSNLTWENTVEYDFGLEFNTLKNRLTGEVSYYNKKVANLLDNVPIAATSGAQQSTALENIGTVQNKGWEFSLKWADKIGKDWSYHISGNISLNKNEVLSLNGGQAIYDGGILSQEYSTITNTGMPIGSFDVLQVTGIFQSEAQVQNYKNAQGVVIEPNAKPGDFIYKDVNGDGKIDDNDRVNAGSYQPKFFYGGNVGVNFKAFDLSVNIYGVSGNKVYNGKKAFRQTLTDNIEASQAYNRWTPSNGSETEPAANGGNLPASTYFIESGSFVRINNLTLGYTLPASLINKIKLKSIRAYVSAQNLYTYQKYSGFTPELPGSPTASGIELNAYPTARTLVFGLNVKF